MKRSLKDKVVWITGAGSGIGQNAAITLSNLGMKVILSGRDEKKLEITSNQCVNNTIIKSLDVSDNDKVESVSESIIKDFKKIDILINSAGTNVEYRDWDVINKSDWDNIFNTNVNGLFYCCKSTLPHMKKEKDGLIINISSWEGREVSLLSGVTYTSSKHAVNAMTETINMKYCNFGIRACALCPGEVSTPILDKRPKKLSEEQKNKMLQPDDLGETIAFLCQMPKHVCINELVISPTWHRRYIADLGIEEL